MLISSVIFCAQAQNGVTYLRIEYYIVPECIMASGSAGNRYFIDTTVARTQVMTAILPCGGTATLVVDLDPSPSATLKVECKNGHVVSTSSVSSANSSHQLFHPCTDHGNAWVTHAVDARYYYVDLSSLSTDCSECDDPCPTCGGNDPNCSECGGGDPGGGNNPGGGNTTNITNNIDNSTINIDNSTTIYDNSTTNNVDADLDLIESLLKGILDAITSPTHTGFEKGGDLEGPEKLGEEDFGEGMRSRNIPQGGVQVPQWVMAEYDSFRGNLNSKLGIEKLKSMLQTDSNGSLPFSINIRNPFMDFMGGSFPEWGVGFHINEIKDQQWVFYFRMFFLFCLVLMFIFAIIKTLTYF